MKDDLAAILESIRNTQTNIIARLEKLERGQDVSGANELVVPGGWGYASPTSPPTKFLSVRRGYAWRFDVDTLITRSRAWADFQLELPISAFTDAYYYRAVVPFYDLNFGLPEDGFDVWEGTTDYETYEECAQYLAHRLQYGYPIDTGHESNPIFTICGLAIRNNGTTGSTNEYLPITLTDRAQSSFILRDLRPWFQVTWDM